MSDLNIVKYGDHEVALGKLPPVSLHRLASYGLAHFLGNQQASKVVAWAQKDENKDATDEQKQAQKLAFQTKAVQSLLDGTIGQHAARGPAVDPIEAEMERIAKAEVIVVLKKNSIKVPKGDEAVTFPDGSTKTMENMIESRLDKNGERIRKEAEASLKEKARAAKKRADAATGASLADL